MNKNLLGAFVLAGTLLVGGVANAANWNGLANYPEVPNSANGSETDVYKRQVSSLWLWCPLWARARCFPLFL